MSILYMQHTETVASVKMKSHRDCSLKARANNPVPATVLSADNTSSLSHQQQPFPTKAILYKTGHKHKIMSILIHSRHGC